MEPPVRRRLQRLEHTDDRAHHAFPLATTSPSRRPIAARDQPSIFSLNRIG
ncbi:hypothetical protein HSB1_42160 [Halogranum salarium B-1]|uniref:Uncharacterized protein n=1 Tax=Halogranum salarium B-1 TaxID=1210908 RepID=J2ZWX3_9EURY|nr:hypothetical protein HSB1_42160 [Halogranum salarium B-1]